MYVRIVYDMAMKYPSCNSYTIRWQYAFFDRHGHAYETLGSSKHLPVKMRVS